MPVRKRKASKSLQGKTRASSNLKREQAPNQEEGIKTDEGKRKRKGGKKNACSLGRALHEAQDLGMRWKGWDCSLLGGCDGPASVCILERLPQPRLVLQSPKNDLRVNPPHC